ncbi:MAG: glycosyltransferase, partial [Sphingopyxis sp.]
GHSADLSIADATLPVVRGFGDARRALATITSTGQADIVHGQFGSLVGMATGVQRGATRLVSLRGSDMHWRYGSLRDRASALVRMGMSWFAALRCHGIIVMSHAMAQRLRRWPFMRRAAIHIIPDPAGDMFWPGPVADIAAQLGQHPQKIVAASVQHDNPIKRLHIIADAVALCQRAGLCVTLDALSGRTRADVRAAILAADCVALSSTHEGWPNIIKEALLLGKSFVATPVSDLHHHAGVGSMNHVVAPHPVDFACAWVDQMVARIIAPHGISPALAPFHPDGVAAKHRLLYQYYGGAAA